MKRSWKPLLVAALLVVGSSSLPAMAAQPAEVAPAAAGSASEKVLRYEVSLSQSAELKTALRTTDYHGYPVVALRFENPQIVGEYAIEGTQTPDEFLQQFDETYGTQPMIVAAVVEVPESEVEALDAAVRQDGENARKARDAAPPSFVAQPADQQKVKALFESHQSGDSSSRQANDTLIGSPNYGEFEIYRPSTNTVRFTQFYTWGSGERPTQVDESYGLEFEINIRTAADGYQTGSRPLCAADYKTRPFAANENWTWSALVNAGNGLTPVAGAVGAYADYNDASNDCNLNSMAIGLRTPQALPANPSGITELLITIDAPRGQDNTGVVNALVQSISESWCEDFPLLSNTDCMGVAAGSVGVRPSLSESRGWTAPTLCWTSGNFGSDAPVKSGTCPLW